MKKVDDITSYIRQGLSKYIGAKYSDDLKQRLARDVVNLINKTYLKFDNVWKVGPPKIGDFVEICDYQGRMLTPDNMTKSEFDINKTITFMLMMPGDPLLVLAIEGRGSDMIRVMSFQTGNVGWIDIRGLKPFKA